MSVLGRFPRWLRWVLLSASLGGSAAVLINWWLAVWPNLAAAWFQGSVIAAIAAPLGAWYTRWSDRHHSGHHADTRAHITAEVTTSLAPIQRSLDELHAKIDQQQGGAP